jgi:selenocysteine lyase/cysteine desulfurase
VSFTHDKKSPDLIAEELARQNIFVWSGHNYALEVARTLGLLESGGAVRVGPVHYNSMSEIDETLEALSTILTA